MNMTGTEILAMYKEADRLRDIYLELRDAKSDGCCHGMTIPEILKYDARIMAAYENMAKEYNKIADLTR